MRKFNHKKLGREVVQTFDDMYRVNNEKSIAIPAALIENSTDREEIKENKVAYNGMAFSDEAQGYYLGDTLGIWKFSELEKQKKFMKRLKVIKYLRKRSAENDEGFVPNWSDLDQGKFEINYDYEDKERVMCECMHSQTNFFIPHFSSEEMAERCIEECKDILSDLLD